MSRAVSAVASAINKWGQNAALISPDGAVNCRVRAFIQPLRYTSRNYSDDLPEYPGGVNNSKYLWIGPAEADISALVDNGWIISDGIRYRVEKSDRIRLGDELLYYHGILSRAGEDG